ncbi:UDP-N-acetylmuramate dehydrogenase [Propionivibrio limicola]|uniref:UDP-N-acetylmuramate dehydrogenase n=1 Tax=Propionivibrio limicola TaxID=167645 RepID=UPI001290F288|nr:UDP-N-acetylmuramate dehydrogenase [Propionivibrio limicola]
MHAADLPDFVEREANLAKRNTLGLPAHAALYARITSVEQLAALADFYAPGDCRFFVLGGGSNLVLSGDFDGLVLHMAMSGRALVGEDADAWYVRAGAGENWHDFVQWTLAQGWPGLENLSLIPGTVGAAPIQNIGAYGLEAGDRFHALTAFDMQRGESVRFDRAGCRFGYRDSVFKQEGWHLDGRFVITDVTFRLPKHWQPLTGYADIAKELAAQAIEEADARQIADAVIAVRQSKLPDPAEIPNTGSFFHNPVVAAATAEQLLAAYPNLPHYPQADGGVKLAAGWLIDQAGWKGKDLGPVGMYEKQALVLVNRGGATGADVLALMQAVQRDVQEKFGVELTPEPVFL